MTDLDKRIEELEKDTKALDRFWTLATFEGCNDRGVDYVLATRVYIPKLLAELKRLREENEHLKSKMPPWEDSELPKELSDEDRDALNKAAEDLMRGLAE